MPTYRHLGSQTMFCSFLRAPFHQPGLSDRFRLHTLLFTAFIYRPYYSRNWQVLSSITFLSSQQQGNAHGTNATCQLSHNHCRQQLGSKTGGKAQMVTKHKGR